RQVVILRWTAPASFYAAVLALTVDLGLLCVSLAGMALTGALSFAFGLVPLCTKFASGVLLRAATLRRAGALGTTKPLPATFTVLLPLTYAVLWIEHLTALFHDTITWRGVTYRLNGAFESEVLSKPPSAEKESAKPPRPAVTHVAR